MTVRTLTVSLLDFNLAAVDGCRVEVELIRAGVESGSLVIPTARDTGRTDDTGVITFTLWPNDEHARYRAKIFNARGSKAVDGYFDMPDENANLADIIVFEDVLSSGSPLSVPGLPAATTINDGDLFLLYQGRNKRSPASLLKSYIGAFANPMTQAGDLILGGVDGAPSRMAKGLANTFLGVNGAGAIGYYAVAGGSSKPKAPANQTVVLSDTGTIITAADAFATLDAFDYSGTPYYGQITVPAGYVLSPADQCAWIGRKDLGSWFKIVSAQFPTPHTTTGSFNTNFLGITKTVFGFYGSAFHTVSVSIDDSANTGSTLVPFVCIESEGLVVGNFSFQKAIFRGATSLGAIVLNSTVIYALITANAMSFKGNAGSVAPLQFDGMAGVLSYVQGNDYDSSNFVVYVNADTEIVVRGNVCDPAILISSSGSYSLQLAGSFVLFGTVTISASAGYSAPITAAGDLSLTVKATWKPLTSGEHFIETAPGGYGQQKRITVDMAGWGGVDTSTTTEFGNLVHIGTVSTAFATQVEVLSANPSDWGANAPYNITPNSKTAPGGGAYSSFVIDLAQPSFKNTLAINTQGGDYTLQLSDFYDDLGYLNCDGSSPQTITVPANSAVPVPVGSVLTIEDNGTGGVTVVGDTDVTVESSTTLSSFGQYAIMMLVKKAEDQWVLTGDRA